MYFETKVSCLQQDDNGLIKRVTYYDLVDAVSWTDCEARLSAHYEGGSKHETEIKTIQPSKISEVLGGNSDTYWKVKVVYLDGEDKPKKARIYLLVSGKDETEACDEVRLKFADFSADWSIEAVTLSKIGEVI